VRISGRHDKNARKGPGRFVDKTVAKSRNAG
jgi:hypothetical protein